jgi:subtilase family serine protease
VEQAQGESTSAHSSTQIGASALAGTGTSGAKAVRSYSTPAGTAFFAEARDAPADASHTHCHALVRSDANGNITPATTPSGWAPADLQSAYRLPSTGGAGQTVAIVDAYDNPNAESDLAVYRAQFGLPPCTVSI